MTSRDWVPGIGLQSMRERAEELGGALWVTAGTDGSQIEVTYPLASVDLTGSVA